MGRTTRSYEEGFGIVYGFILILFLAALLLGLGILLRNGGPALPGEDQIIAETETQEVVEKVIQSLLGDESPESDSLQDGIWQTLPSLGEEHGAEITLRDISSRVNPNHWRNEIIDETALQALLFKEGHTMEELEQHRLDNGMGQNWEAAYPGFFSDEALNYLTPYGYLNLNIASEPAIAELYTLRTGDDFGAESFRAKVQKTRMAKTYLNNASVKDFFPPGEKKLYPFFAAVPLLNIHFIPRKILRGVLSHNFGSSPLPQGANTVDKILEERESREFRSEELQALFGLENFNHPIYDYLGVKTWFWRITVKKNGMVREVILAELPDSETPYRPDGKPSSSEGNRQERRFQIIQNRFRIKEDPSDP